MTRVVLVLLLTTPLFAQNGASLTLTLEPAKTTVLSGERLDVTVTVDNHGGEEATFVNFYVTVAPAQQSVTVTARPAGFASAALRTASAARPTRLPRARGRCFPSMSSC